MTAPYRRSLLELDPDLGALLADDRRADAHRDLTVQVTQIRRGAWDAERLAGTHASHLGLLVVSGVVAREVVVRDTISTELLGPGDLLRPWALEPTQSLLPVVVRWNALTAVEAAVLDRHVGSALNAYPEIRAVLVDRLDTRAQRLAVTHAIATITGVEHRLEALLWHFADRWGRVATDGVLVPLALSHRLLGQLVGARRPTVSTAVARLTHDGRLARRADGEWLLTGPPPPAPALGLVDVLVTPRARLEPTPARPTTEIVPRAA